MMMTPAPKRRQPDYSWTTNNDPDISHRRYIGQGGYAEVHEVSGRTIYVTDVEMFDSKERVSFARKFIRLSTDVTEDEVDEEVATTMKICKPGHQNIVQVLRYDWLHSGSTCFIDMELCTLTLSDYISRRSLFTEQTSTFVSEDCSGEEKLINIWTVTHHIAQGLDYIHQLGYTHRDLKPANDFGLTAEATSRLAVTTRFSRGTAGYRAPELLKTSKFTNKVDIWAFGCIIYELAMGKKAFSDDYAVDSYSDSRSALQLSISLVPESHRVYLEYCVWEMLERNPEQRPSSSIILARVKSYCMLLDLQSLEELELMPPYAQWKEMAGEKPREVTDFFSDLVGWYQSAKRNDALTQVFTALVKRYSDVKEFRQRLATGYDGMSNLDTELWRELVDENPSEEILCGKLAKVFLVPGDRCPVSQALKEMAKKHAENIQRDSNALIFIMARGGSFKDVCILLDRGASVAATDGNGYTPLHFAAQNGRKDVVALLLDKGASVAATDRNGCTPLHFAAQNGHKDVVALLLDSGASLALTDIYGRTAFHEAAWHGHRDVVELILDKHFNPNP